MKIKSVKAWAVWNENKKEPWGGLIVGCKALQSYALFISKKEAEHYREIAWSSPDVKAKQKIISVIISPIKRKKK